MSLHGKDLILSSHTCYYQINDGL